MSRNAKTAVARLLTTLLVVMVSVPAIADLPGPGPRHYPPRPPIPVPVTSNSVPILIRVDPQAKESVLRIPKRFLPAAKVGAIEEQQPNGAGSMRHIIAALALSGAITGLFFVRRDRKIRAAVVIVVCVCAIAAAGTLMANAPAPAPPVPQRQPHQPDSEPNPPAALLDKNEIPAALRSGVNGDVIIQVTDGGTAVNLIISAKLAKSSGLTASADSPTPAVSAPAPARAPNPSP